MLHRQDFSRNYHTAHALVIVGAILMPAQVNAQLIKPADGQASGPAQFDNLTVELGLRTNSDFSGTSVRLTLPRLADAFVIYIDGSRFEGELDDIAINGTVVNSGDGGGAGIFYTGLSDFNSLQPVLNFSLHSHASEVDNALSVSGRQAIVEDEWQTAALSLILSPRQPWNNRGFNGFVSIGLAVQTHERSLSVDDVEQTEFSTDDTEVRANLAAGLVYPIGRLRFHATLDFDDEVFANLGIRWHVSRKAR